MELSFVDFFQKHMPERSYYKQLDEIMVFLKDDEHVVLTLNKLHEHGDTACESFYDEIDQLLLAHITEKLSNYGVLLKTSEMVHAVNILDYVCQIEDYEDYDLLMSELYDYEDSTEALCRIISIMSGGYVAEELMYMLEFSDEALRKLIEQLEEKAKYDGDEKPTLDYPKVVERVKKLKPKDPTTYNKLVLILREGGRLGLPFRFYMNEFIAMDEKDSKVNDLAAYYAFSTAASNQTFSKALKLFERRMSPLLKDSIMDATLRIFKTYEDLLK